MIYRALLLILLSTVSTALPVIIQRDAEGIDHGIHPTAKETFNNVLSGSCDTIITDNVNTYTTECIILSDGRVIAAGSTLLHAATNLNNMNTVKALLNCKANPNARDEEHLTPLHLSTWHGNTQISQALIIAHADPCAQTDRGITPVRNAAVHGTPELLRLLIENGGDVDSGQFRQDAVKEALKFKKSSNAIELLAYGANNNSMYSSEAEQLNIDNVPSKALHFIHDVNARNSMDETQVSQYAKVVLGQYIDKTNIIDILKNSIHNESHQIRSTLYRAALGLIARNKSYLKQVHNNYHNNHIKRLYRYNDQQTIYDHINNENQTLKHFMHDIGSPNVVLSVYNRLLQEPNSPATIAVAQNDSTLNMHTHT